MKAVIKVGTVYVNKEENGVSVRLRTAKGGVRLGGENLLKLLTDSGVAPQTTVQTNGRPSWAFARAEVTGNYDEQAEIVVVTNVRPAPLANVGDVAAFEEAVKNAQPRPPRPAAPAAQPAPASAEPTMPF